MRIFIRQLPIAKIIVIVIGVLFTTTTTTLVFAQQNKPLSSKVIAKHTTPTTTPTKKLSPTPAPTKKALPSPTPASAIKNDRGIGGTNSQTQSNAISPITPTSIISPITPVPSITAPTTTPPPSNPATSSIIDQVNAYRASQGLDPVQTSAATCAFAATRAQEIVSNFSHDAFNSRIANNTLPYSSWTAATENIAQTSNPQNVVPMWINSPGHAANMRADTPYVCIQQNGDYYAYEGMKP